MGTQREPCSMCSGTGKVQCLMCDGSGKSPFVPSSSPAHLRKCSYCKGTGTGTCAACSGSGTQLSLRYNTTLSSINATRPSWMDIGSFGRASRRVLGAESDRRQPASIRLGRSGLDDTAILLGLLAVELVALAVITFGWKQFLVAAEAFFVMAGFAVVRAGRIFGDTGSQRLTLARDILAIGAGVSIGVLAAYLILTEGQVVTDWVTEGTLRMAGSLIASVVGFGVIESLWRLFVER